MIHRITYAGKYIKEEDGQKQTIPIDPRSALAGAGPFLEVVMIIPPKVICEKLEKEGKEIPNVRVRALIDTGASCTVILPEIAQRVGLIHTGYEKITSVQDEQRQPVYFGAILFPWGAAKEIPLVACPLKHFGCLIGRDVLLHWYLTYDGPNGTIVICD
ncbi:MAG: hypothetical protein ACE5K8_01095 [Candidatus Zixiibacteriota bacterium]